MAEIKRQFSQDYFSHNQRDRSEWLASQMNAACTLGFPYFTVTTAQTVRQANNTPTTRSIVVTFIASDTPPEAQN